MLIDSEKLKEKIAGLFEPNAYTSFEEKQVMERYKVSVENAIYYAERDAKKNEQAVEEKYADKYAAEIEKTAVDSYNHGYLDGIRHEKSKQEEETEMCKVAFERVFVSLVKKAQKEMNEVKSHDT